MAKITRRRILAGAAAFGVGVSQAGLSVRAAFSAPAAGATTSVAEPSVVPSSAVRPALASPRPYAYLLHGVEIEDPFQWMEQGHADEVRHWAEAQRAYAELVLRESPGLPAVQAAMNREFEAAPNLEEVTPIPGGLIYDRWLASGREFRLLRDGEPERVLFDRNLLAKAGRSSGVRAVIPSWDGRHAAVTTTGDGDGAAQVSVIDVASGTLLPDIIPDFLTTTSGARYRVTWLPDGSGFVYPRLAAGALEGPSVDRLAKGRQYLHVLGTPQSADVPVFGFGLDPAVSFAPDDLPSSVVMAPGSPWMLATLFRVRTNTSNLMAARIEDVLAGKPGWTQLAGDGYRQARLYGDRIYAITTTGADRGRIVSRDLRQSRGRWQTVVREQAGVLQGVAVAADGIYFVEYLDGVSHLRRLAHGMRTVERMRVPIRGDLQFAPQDPTRGSPWVKAQGWTDPGGWYRTVPGQANVAPGGLDSGGTPLDQSAIVVRHLMIEADDGVRIPVSLVHLASLQLHAGTPLLLEAYGGYGRVQAPAYNPGLATWVRQGAVYAYAHVRGGGERGSSWRKAALRERKVRSSLDVIAVARALIRLGYTSRRRIAILGTSAGAQMPGLAVATAPELFGAAIFDVGQSDEIRGAHQDPTAARNLAEMGDIDTPEGVRLLARVSPYHRVPRTARLPGMIVKSGADDYNFGGSSTDAKYVARLQAANSGDRPIVWLNAAGGHSSVFGNDPDIAARAISFMLWQTGHPAFQPKAVKN